MNAQNRHHQFVKALIIALILAATIWVPVTQANPLYQGADPRPGSGGGSGGGTGGGGGNGGGQGDSDNGGSSSGGNSNTTCASLVGQVINWGFGGEGGVTTELQAGSWQLNTISASDGNYGFGSLGVGPAVLHIDLSPEQGRQFDPSIQNAGVYLNCDFPIVANIALTKSNRDVPPATITVSASNETLIAGQESELTITVRNRLPNEITNVVVTLLLSPGLTASDVAADVDSNAIKIVDAEQVGQIVAINLDTVPRRDSEVVKVTIEAADELPFNAQLTGAATLFYRESAAHQAMIEFTEQQSDDALPLVVESEPTVAVSPPEADLPQQATTEPTATPTPTATPEPTATAIPSPEPTEEAEPVEELAASGEEFVPPGKLPTTGQDMVAALNLSRALNPLLPIGGLAVAGLIFGWHQWRSSRRKRKRN